MSIKTSRIKAWRWQHCGVADDLLDFLSSYDFLHCPEHSAIEIFKHTPRKGVVWARLSWSGERFFIKARCAVKLSRRLSMMHKASSSRVEWDHMAWLEQSGLHTTQRLAVGECRKWRMLDCDVLLVRWEEQALALEHYHQQLMATAVDKTDQAARQAALMRRVGKTLAEMHQRLCFHRQFHFGNVMLRGDDPATAEVLLIDLKHLSILPQWSDTEWLWSFYVLPYWLRAPVIDWSASSSDLQYLIDGYFHERASGFASSQAMFEYLRAIVPQQSPDTLHPRPKKISSSWLESELGIKLTQSFQ